MAWNDPNIPVTGPVPAYGPTPPAQPGGQPPAMYQPTQPPAGPMGAAPFNPANQQFSQYGQSPPPMQQPQYGQPPQYAPAGQATQPSYGPNPIVAGQVPTPPGMPYGPAVAGRPGSAAVSPAAGVPPANAKRGGVDSDAPDASDDIWIERTKRAIAETQNDPHRQVQLLQHLNKLYLKERFGREVQADKS